MMDSEKIFLLFLIVFVSTSLLIVAGIVTSLIINSYQIFLRDGLSFIFKNVWNPVKEDYGILPALLGTLISSAIAISIAMPLAISLAIFSAEIAPTSIRGFINSVSDLMASLPSVIYGLWGLYVLAPILNQYIMTPLYQYLGFIPLFSTKPIPTNLFTAGVLLAIMITPFSSSIIREAYNAIPHHLKEAAYSLGMTRWEVIRTLLGYIKSAILAGAFLALGRAMGETVAVAMVVGNTFTLPRSLFDMGYTISSLIANQFPNAEAYSYMMPALYGGALVLFMVGLIINLAGLYWIRRVMTRG
ncbi:MAG: phosphate ABC transporter permease subunit PstC [archaeon YNP-WB-062]|jgi:phosphate transport system permease protein|nr:phosphate ABC transporter permease subunit PstC [Candidatus Culexarchaeum yellowstonense]